MIFGLLFTLYFHVFNFYCFDYFLLMENNKTYDHSLGESHESVDTTQKVTRWKKIFSFIGPAYLVSVGYMDPGNWATDIAGGSKYGYTLIWVLLASNIMAILLQSLSARLGIVRGRDLAQANREYYPKKINFILWVLAEIAIAATDLAEVLGMAIGLQLLFGLPLLVGVSITILDTFLLLYLQKLGMRKIEAFIIALIAIIGISFLINIIIANPSISDILKGFIPSLPDAATLYASEHIQGLIPKESALYLAIGIIGATVMPHNLYLHSALIQTRKIKRTPAGIKEAIKWSIIDSSIALNIAFFINAAILILAATIFFKTGRTDVGAIKQAHELIAPVLGSNIASKLFAIALIAAGQSSTITGTLSGQIVMEGYLKLRINHVTRRLITRLIAIIPTLLFIILNGENNVDQLLIFSQVILSVQLAFAIIPLIHFVSDKNTMNEFVVKKYVQAIAWLMAILLICLNSKMIYDEAYKLLHEHHNIAGKITAIVVIVLLLLLLCYILIFPIVNKRNDLSSIIIHGNNTTSNEISIPSYKKIGIALDFGEDDHKIISAALGQGISDKELVIIHIVESASARLHLHQTDDYETQRDRIRLDSIVQMLSEKGIKAKGILGYRYPAKEIVRIAQEELIDLLIIGAHGHKGIRDFIYGSTINKVRHDLKTPVFIVKL